MGKTPKRNKGSKDPLKLQQLRLNQLKDKINRKPKSTDVQEIPRKLQDIAKFTKCKNIKVTSVPVKKKMKINKNLIDGTKFIERERHERGMTRPNKMIPLLKQHPQETQKNFLSRVDRATKLMMKEQEFEDKFKVDVMRDDRGQVLSITHQEKTDRKILEDPHDSEILSRAQRRNLAKKEREQRKKQKRKINEEEDEDEFSYFQDKVEFGEVVYEPPSLDTKKLTRKVNGGVVKPRSFLFMKKFSAEDSQGMSEEKKASDSVSVARQRIVETERVRAVEAYRKVKAARTHAVTLVGLSGN